MEPSAATYSVSSALMPDDPSFSSYLRPEEPKKTSQEHVADQDAEISIFDAKKYFNESNDNNQRIILGKRVSPVKNRSNHNLCDLSAIPRFSSASSTEGYGTNYRTRSFHATPTASSEASWNSQAGLLSNPPGAISVSLKNPQTNHRDSKRSPGSTPRWLFGRKCPCPCLDKKSVQVEETAFSEQKRTPVHLTPQSKKVLSMSPQTHTPPNSNHPLPQPPSPDKTLVTLTRAWETRLKHETSITCHRLSTENRFPPNLFPTHHRITSTPKPLTIEPSSGFTFPVLNTTAPPSTNPPKPSLSPTKTDNSRRNSLDIYEPPQRQSFTFTASPPKSRIPDEDDIASDGSSDLFEIESISTQTTTTTSYPVYQIQREDSKNKKGPSVSSRRESLDDPLTESYSNYPPSEVSVDWSVNTVVEAFDRSDGMHEESDREIDVVKGGGERRRRTGLLSCRREKAVSSVGPKAVKHVHVGSRTTNGANSTVRCHSARLSHGLDTDSGGRHV